MFRLSTATIQPPNQALQPTASPLRGLSAAELGRYALVWRRKSMASRKDELEGEIYELDDELKEKMMA